MINVTKPFLPPFEQYNGYLKGIWERRWLTNHGPLVNELEIKLKDFLGVKHLFFVSNGTIAIQIAIKALELKKEIITTPFSYVATTSSIVWENCKPVFVDIDPKSLTLDPSLIQDKITKNTEAILATHVYGFPCDVERIKEVADRNNLKVIYDAAHAFGVKYSDRSILEFGDISTLSFHSTKLFHTIEGGAIVTNDDDLAHKISYLRNFGHKGQEDFYGVGINGKNSEINAAMGLCILPEIESIIERRKKISDFYDSYLSNSSLELIKANNKTTLNNYGYYPIIFKDEKSLLESRNILNSHYIYPRRYFYPSLNHLPYVKKVKMNVADSISKRVLCLPLYPDLEDTNVFVISKILNDNNRK